MEHGIIRLTRKRGGGRDRSRRYLVVIDGHVVGKIKQGATEEFAVEPGRHALCLKIDWKGSDEITVTVDAGRVASLFCAPNGSAVAAPLDLVRRRKQWIALRND